MSDNRTLDISLAFGPAESICTAEDWRMETAEHEIAMIHRISAGPFRFNGQRSPFADASGLKCRLVLVEDGELLVDQSYGGRRLGAGEGVLIGDVQLNEIEARGPVTLFVVVLPIWWCINELGGSASISRETVISADFIGARALLEFVRGLFADKGRATSGAAARILGVLLREGLSEGASREAPARNSPAFTEVRMREIYAFICLNYQQEGLSARDAAAALRCSLRTVHKTCADRGTSFNALLIDVRLSAAAYLLSLGRERVSEIAYGSGFVSLSHFCRIFKQRFGLSAGDYRRGAARPIQLRSAAEAS